MASKLKDKVLFIHSKGMQDDLPGPGFVPKNAGNEVKDYQKMKPEQYIMRGLRTLQFNPMIARSFQGMKAHVLAV